MGEYVDYRLEDSVARITLADPERGNPIHHGVVGELGTYVRHAISTRARVIVLSSTGRYFSVGGDLDAFATADDIGPFIEDLAESLHRVVSDLMRADAVVISVIQGPAAGAGFPLAAAADLVVASRAATFSLAYTKVGLSIDGGTSLLVHTLGLHRMLRIALLNDQLTAEDAHELGLVARVVDGNLEDEVNALVARLRGGAADALAATKRLLRTVAEPAPEAAMRAEALSISARASSPDGVEGVSAFLEKRSPEFG